MKKLLPLLCLCWTVVSCANYGLPFNEVISSIPKNQSSEGRVFFYVTDLDSLKSGAKIKVGEHRIGSLGWPYSFLYVDLPKGRHTVTGYRSGLLVSEDHLDLEILGGDTYYIEVLGRAFSVRLLLVAKEEGHLAIQSCLYADP